MSAASLLVRAGRPTWPSWSAVPTTGPRRLANRFRWGREPARWDQPDDQASAAARPVRLGLRQNAAQFTLLVAVNALVGGMLGQERTVLPLLADSEFGLQAYTAALTYILAFGLAKAATNYLAGTWSDRYGRKPVLVAGWILAVPVPLLLIWAPSWAWVVARTCCSASARV